MMIDYKNETLTLLRAIHNKEVKTNVDIFLDHAKKSQAVCAFGISRITRHMVENIERLLGGGIFTHLTDSNTKKLLEGKDVLPSLQKIAKKDLAKLPQDSVFLITCRFEQEIRKDLKAMGFTQIFWLNDLYLDTISFLRDEVKYHEYVEGLSSLFDALSDEKSRIILQTIIQRRTTLLTDINPYVDIYSRHQYFEPDLIKLTPEEVFVDCGAFDGDTVENFIAYAGGKFNKIYALEMDEANYLKMQKRFYAYEDALKQKIVTHKLGVSDQKEEFFYSSLGMMSRLEENKGDKIATCLPLDDIIPSHEKVTLIAMDIEGAELKALQGAKMLIKKHKPRLAISSYHKAAHLFQVFQLIKKLNPAYKFYLRHHSKACDDSVLYAI